MPETGLEVKQIHTTMTLEHRSFCCAFKYTLKIHYTETGPKKKQKHFSEEMSRWYILKGTVIV